MHPRSRSGQPGPHEMCRYREGPPAVIAGAACPRARTEARTCPCIRTGEKERRTPCGSVRSELDPLAAPRRRHHALHGDAVVEGRGLGTGPLSPFDVVRECLRLTDEAGELACGEGAGALRDVDRG